MRALGEALLRILSSTSHRAHPRGPHGAAPATRGARGLARGAGVWRTPSSARACAFETLLRGVGWVPPLQEAGRNDIRLRPDP